MTPLKVDYLQAHIPEIYNSHKPLIQQNFGQTPGLVVLKIWLQIEVDVTQVGYFMSACPIILITKMQRILKMVNCKNEWQNFALETSCYQKWSIIMDCALKDLVLPIGGPPIKRRKCERYWMSNEVLQRQPKASLGLSGTVIHSFS